MSVLTLMLQFRDSSKSFLLEQKMTAVFAITQTYWIELVSIFVLLVHLCALLYYSKTSTSRMEEVPNTKTSAKISEYEIQRMNSIDSGDGHLPSRTGTEHHIVTEVVDEYCLPNIRQPIEDLDDRFLSEIFHSLQTVATEVPKGTAAGAWEPRRSGRSRKATNRFTESWCNGKFRGLGSALGVESYS